MTTSSPPTGKISTNVRLYNARASYQLPAALSILRESPVIHVAFVLPAKGDMGETIMNLPLIAAVVRDPGLDETDHGDEDVEGWAVYLHTHRQSGLVEAIQAGAKTLTATTTKIDGLVFSPTAQDHSLNYRSATLHLHSPLVLPDSLTDPALEEKRMALSEVMTAVTGYARSDIVGQPDDPNTARTTVIKCKIRAISCKQRCGAFYSGKEPVVDAPEGKEQDGFTGVVPCWTEWGDVIGYGRDKEELAAHLKERSQRGRAFAEGTAWADESTTVEGLGKRRPKIETRDQMRGQL